MTEVHENIDKLKEDWDVCKTQTKRRDDLIENLFKRDNEQAEQLSEMRSDLCDKSELIKLNRGRLEEANKIIETMTYERERYAFALVLIDGDCMPFRDDLVKQGLDGGKRTAGLLKNAVQDELQRALPSAVHLQVVVRVYASIAGMEKTYKKAKILSDLDSFDNFVRGFNMGYSMCDYVDAGNGKECSDEKIKATFGLHLKDIHCQKILFGGSADNGYARMLEPCLQLKADRDRIILLEGPPFAQELDKVKDKFGTYSFVDIFRDQKLPCTTPRVSFQITPPDTPIVDYAKAAAKTISTQAITSAPQSSSTALREAASDAIHRNSKGQRVDLTLRFSGQELASIKSRKLCNTFHLLGTCQFRYGNCVYEHGDRLGQGESKALRAVARQSPCFSGLDCEDPDCIAGHRCTRPNCKGENCRFSLEMHGVDTVIVD